MHSYVDKKIYSCKKWMLQNQVILAPKFSESYPLSLQSIPMLMIVAFM
jgi:hypothetical protein